MNISLELIPNSEEHLINEMAMIKADFPMITAINIPDLARFDMRSWDACTLVKNEFPRAIPHLRAIDFNYSEDLPFKSTLLDYDINEVLVLKGDPPQDMSKKVYTTCSVDMIYKIKREMPHVKVYAAIDQYRHSMKDEYEYVQHKLNAGVDGFFTQPFFDIRFLEMYTEMLSGIEIYFGLSPVTSKLSASYWKAKNNVVFPKGFESTYKWNIEFAKKAIEYISMNEGNVYFMPIVVDLKRYLTGVFS
ncbi:MAG: methylenetetrahydrofolate reductase [Vallitaleaceae bacterium]|jgi:methylenetetrahydrofolate reductase (NADPH)|nr:methylenetetrahydrofolate reductase [Vallitaleaceae bacterium]